jgi:predicted ester cyclase
MNSTAADNKEFVIEYLRSLSGQVKTAELVARFVSDPALAEHIRQAEAAFPRYELQVDGIIAEGDLVSLRGTFRGVQRGAFANIPATGREVAAGLMIFYRLEGRRIVEHWMQFDAAGLIAQLTEARAVRA